jgi:DNA adenine methylase
MAYIDSPLRYPGGKSQMVPLVVEVLRANNLFYGHYIEAFAGGAGVAWTLLTKGYVTRVTINDLDPSIHAFWASVLNHTDEFCDRIDGTRVNRAEWRRQRAIQRASRPRQLDLGFSTFFLNRTNRSGIIQGGIIGGMKQDGDYPIDCRFNKPDLIRRIRRIAQYRDRIALYRLDAAIFIQDVLPGLPERALVYLDPPYYIQGPVLYSNHYNAQNHAELAAAVGTIQQRWMVTYDNRRETKQLYAAYPQYRTSLNYTAQVKRKGTELLVLDPRLVPPSCLTRDRIAA